MKTKKTNGEKKLHEADFLFHCGDFQKMAEMMENCCSGEGGAVDCCSVMKRMMEKWKDAGKPQETQKPPKAEKTAEDSNL